MSTPRSMPTASMCLRKDFGERQNSADLLVILPLAADQLQSVGMKHLHRRNMDVTVSDQVCRQL